MLFFQNQPFSKDSFRNTIRLSNRLDQDRARRFVRPGLGPNCFLQKLSAEDTREPRVNFQCLSIFLALFKPVPTSYTDLQL